MEHRGKHQELDSPISIYEVHPGSWKHVPERHIEGASEEPSAIGALLRHQQRRRALRVRDDGIGMDPQILRRGQRAGHWGLPGMRERSKSFGGQLDVWSEMNAGTEVELRISAKIAYARRKPR